MWRIIFCAEQDITGLVRRQIRRFASASTSLPASEPRSGVRQGCVLAPALFCRAMDWIMDRAMPHRGVTISGENIPNSDYADDIVALEGDLADITRTLESIEAASSELGLHISWAKKKVQNIGADQSVSNLLVNGETVQGVQSFVHLCSSINSADGSRSEQLRRIGIAAGNMNNLECIWRQPHLLATKLRLYMTLIVPMLLVVQALPTLETSSRSAGTLSLAASPAWTHKPQLM